MALTVAVLLVPSILTGCKSTPTTPACPVLPANADDPGIIVTMVGTLGGTSGNQSGDGKCATGTNLSFPSSLDFAADGTLYFTDLNNLRVRRMNSNGTIQTVAGGGTTGHISGPPTDWYLFHPAALARDAQGNLFTAVWHGNVVTRLTPQGTLSIVAGDAEGSGNTGNNVPALGAQLKEPRGLAFDGQGNLYIAEAGGHRVRVVDAVTGMIRTVAGTGVEGFSGDGDDPLLAQLDEPYGVALASDGTLYIADSGNNRIRAVNPARSQITTFAGTGSGNFTGDNGPPTEATLDHPQDIKFGLGGTIYIADTFNHCIRRIQTIQGLGLIMTTVAGVGRHPGSTGDGGAARTAQLDSPDGIALDSQGNLWIADTYNQRIRRVHVPF